MPGSELVGLALPRPVRRPRPGARGRAPRDPLGRGLARGGHRHRPHRARRRPGGLRARPRPRPAGALSPSTRRAASTTSYGWLHGLSTTEAADQIVGWLAEQGVLLEAGTYVHRYPHCWRCDTPLIFRVTDDWIIAVDELRPPLLEANATVEWTPEYMGKRMDDWLRNMGDWNISRRRYYGLPLPIYPCECGHVTLVGLEGGAGGARDRPASTSSRSCAGPGSTRCRSAARPAARRCAGSPRSATSGSTPASSRSRRSAGRTPSGSRRGYATGAARGLTTADLPDHAYWEQWFPADWVSEMREQIRLWFYSQLFMSVALTGPGAVPAGARLREDARRERPRDARLVGQHDRRARRRSRAWAPT